MKTERAILLVLLAASMRGRMLSAAIIASRLPEFTGERVPVAEVEAALAHMERAEPPAVQGIRDPEGVIQWQLTTAGKGRAVAQ